MRRSKCHIAVWCFLLLTVACVCASAQKTADDLWEDYRDANQNASAASNNYNTQVRAAKEASQNLDKNKKTFLDMVKSWFEKGDLEALKAFAEQAASDAHRVSVTYDNTRDEAYRNYTRQYKKENPSGTPKPPFVDVAHKKYNCACQGGCGVSWDNLESAKVAHRLTCPGRSAPVAGCGKSYYGCTDTSHNTTRCARWNCLQDFRECSNSVCLVYSGSLWPLPFNHSSGDSGTPTGTIRPGRNICEKCNQPHG